MRYLSTDNLSHLNSYDVVIDCTAKDDIINLLSQISERKTFVSVSVASDSSSPKSTTLFVDCF